MVNAEKITVYKWITLIQNKLKKIILVLQQRTGKLIPIITTSYRLDTIIIQKSNTLPAHLQNIKKITNEHIS